MCNCNQQRAAYASQKVSEQRGMVKVQLIENKPMILRGKKTGRLYKFKNINEIILVDKRDAINYKEIEELIIID